MAATFVKKKAHKVSVTTVYFSCEVFLVLISHIIKFYSFLTTLNLLTFAIKL